jgi:hypothetical protein
MRALISCFILLGAAAVASPAIKAGYKFVDGHSHTTIAFERYRDLIVIPVWMNDSIKLRLVLDTGTRSLVVYGKKFRRLQNLMRDKKIKITGWGSPKGVEACLSYPNTITMGKIRGESLGVAVVDKGKMFADIPTVDGIIGYELFARFAVEINYRDNTIRLFDRLPEGHTDLFIGLPLEINKARPQVISEIKLVNNKIIRLKLLIDTGSTFGLAVFSTSNEGFPTSNELLPVGRGLNGQLFGRNLFVKELLLGDLPIQDVPTHLVDVPVHPDDQFTFAGSLGAGFLRHHVVIFDYPRNMFFLSKERS